MYYNITTLCLRFSAQKIFLFLIHHYKIRFSVYNMYYFTSESGRNEPTGNIPSAYIIYNNIIIRLSRFSRRVFSSSTTYVFFFITALVFVLSFRNALSGLVFVYTANYYIDLFARFGRLHSTPPYPLLKRFPTSRESSPSSLKGLTAKDFFDSYWKT